MAVAFFMDAHVHREITNQLRQRGVDVLTAQEDQRADAPDEMLLTRAHELRRVLLTQDIGFRVLAEEWQRDGREFSGLFFGRQHGHSIGEYVNCLALIAVASEQDEWCNAVVWVPF